MGHAIFLRAPSRYIFQLFFIFFVLFRHLFIRTYFSTRFSISPNLKEMNNNAVNTAPKSPTVIASEKVSASLAKTTINPIQAEAHIKKASILIISYP